MIIEVKISLVEGIYAEENCVRVIEMDENATLSELHDAIQDAVSFDREHLYDFYFANSPHARKRVSLTELDDWVEWDEREKVFMRTRLKNVRPEGRRRLYYLFDFGDSWLFDVKIASKRKPNEEGVRYPRVIKTEGPNPQQYPIWEE